MSLLAVATIQEMLGISGEDTRLDFYNQAVQAEIETIVGRKLEQQVYVAEVLEYGESSFDAVPYVDVNINYGTPSILLENWPIIQASGFQLSYSGTVITSDNYELDYEAGIIYIYSGQSDYRRQLTASYTAGYTSATAPYDLREVILEGVRYAYELGFNAKSGSTKVKSKSVKNFSVAYNDAANRGVINGIKSYLNNNMHILEGYMRDEE